MYVSARVKKRASISPAFVTFWQVAGSLVAVVVLRLGSFWSCWACILYALSPDAAWMHTHTLGSGNGALHYLNGKIMLQIPPLWSWCESTNLILAAHTLQQKNIGVPLDWRGARSNLVKFAARRPRVLYVWIYTQRALFTKFAARKGPAKICECRFGWAPRRWLGGGGD